MAIHNNYIKKITMFPENSQAHFLWNKLSHELDETKDERLWNNIMVKNVLIL
jgi:hypothetical protein